MKNEEPQQHQLDEQAIREAAAAALLDLQLDVGIESVCADGERWRVQFTAEYHQLCDSFRDRLGKENSFELIREKVKRHLLKQQQSKIRASVRIRRGQPKASPSTGNPLETAVKTIEGIAGQTAGVAGEIISRAVQFPERVLTALDDATQAVLPAQKAKQPLARVTLKVAAAKTARKSSSAVHKASAKKGRTAKKAGSKSKLTTAKTAPRSTKKRGRAKRSTK